MRVVIYARYSSDQQRDASIDDQLRICRVRAEREGWTIAETFTDHAISGATLLRPGYQALLAYLRGPGAEIVLAESLDRFSRDQEHIAAFYKQASFARARIFTLAEGEVSELHIGFTQEAVAWPTWNGQRHRPRLVSPIRRVALPGDR